MSRSPQQSNKRQSHRSDILSLTKFFFELTPDKILDAVETVGVRCTGRCLAMNSMENRVYEVEIDLDDEAIVTKPSDRFRVIKFYRPGRWSREQIEEEHRFLLDLKESDIPVVAPLPNGAGETLSTIPGIDIHFAVFPKQGGRNPDELSFEQLEQVGRLLARMHNVGETSPAPSRVRIHPEIMAAQSFEQLSRCSQFPTEIAAQYGGIVDELCAIASPWFEEFPIQRIHGDCHYGNLLWGSEGPYWVDFDDMSQGPCVQDLWLLIPGRDDYARQQLNALLDGYEQMRDFDRRSLRLIEPLRAMRMIYFSAWIAKRWEDPAFQRTFVDFGSPKYWREQMMQLMEQMELIREGAAYQYGGNE